MNRGIKHSAIPSLPDKTIRVETRRVESSAGGQPAQQRIEMPLRDDKNDDRNEKQRRHDRENKMFLRNVAATKARDAKGYAETKMRP
ncbi:MAG TPA: hypothetical protein VGN12_23945 [Pirellulales bacterium]|jgi:hypothetical protein